MPAQSDFFLPLLAEAWYHDVVTVVSGGNEPHHTLGDRSPQRYGTAGNALITVAQVVNNGFPTPLQSSPGPARDGVDIHLVGSLTTFAHTENIRVANAYDPIHQYRISFGASYAAPQIAGLAAYLQGVPNAPTPGQGTAAMEMKEQIIRQRRAGSGSVAGDAVANNGVHEIFCPPSGPPKKARRTVDYITKLFQGSRTFLGSLFTRSHTDIVPRQNQDPQLTLNPVYISGAYFADDLSSRVSISGFCHPLKPLILIADITTAVPMPRAYRAPIRLQH